MKKAFAGGLFLAAALCVQAQYNGKYVGWSAGYIFTGSLDQVAWKAYTHLLNFQVEVSADGGVNTDNLAIETPQFVSAVHQHGLKALICIGGQGQSENFTAACQNPATQTKLVRNILKLVRDGGYDGVDMDWEAGEENDDPPMVARFKSLHKELRDSINKMSPKPLMTAAVATSWYPNCTAAIAGYVDQLNNMSYYNPVTDLDWIFEPVLDQGVPKTLQGVGFGFDSDDEITDVHDIAAKCRYAIDKGYGGIMVWDITHAPASTSDSIAKYVSLSHTSIAYGAFPGRGLGSSRGLATLSVRSTGSDGSRVITYSSAASLLDLGLYDMRGACIRTLAHGPGAGTRSLILESGSRPGSLRPGAYVLKLSSGSDAGIAKSLHIP